MPRTVDPAVHAVRRDVFIDVATGLIQTKGYEQMSIQDVLEGANASRGAFYHYFDSKASLVEAVVDRMVETALLAIQPILDDPDLSATERLRRIFGGIAAWKADQRDLILAVLDIWLSDDNAIVREQLRRRQAVALRGLLQTIVDQGIREGTFQTDDPDEVAGVLVTLFQGAGETVSQQFLARGTPGADAAGVIRRMGAYRAAFERILAAPPGSLVFVEDDVIHDWFD